MNRPRQTRILRILWTVACATACVLLIVLWARSYWWVDLIDAHNTHVRIEFCSVRGEVGVGIQPYSIPFHGPTPRWQYESYEPDYKEEFPQPSLFGFAYIRSTVGWSCFLPHWALILGIAALGTVPWKRSSKRFSLRTLLTAMTLVAVVLGLIVCVSRQ
jgi:hypothetical protein